LHAFFGLPGFFAAGLPGNIIYLQLQGWMPLKKILNGIYRFRFTVPTLL
jgi:hypothetical protein